MYSMDLQLVICKYQYKCIIYFSFLRKINTVFPSRIPLSLPLSLSLSLSLHFCYCSSSSCYILRNSLCQSFIKHQFWPNHINLCVCIDLFQLLHLIDLGQSFMFPTSIISVIMSWQCASVHVSQNLTQMNMPSQSKDNS